jgi:hypothetical protein
MIADGTQFLVCTGLARDAESVGLALETEEVARGATHEWLTVV